MMDRVLLLARREVNSLFVSPLAYVAMALFLLVTGAFFAAPYLGSFREGNPAGIQFLFGVMTFLLTVIVPLISMRTFAEERAAGTLESLLTAPVTDVQVVTGKFLGCTAFMLVMLAPTLLYVLVLRAFGQPDLGPILAGYVGLVFLGMAYVAVGLAASSLTRHMLIAFIVGLLVLALLWLIGPVSGMVPSPYRTILREASTYAHYTDFGKGVVDIVHIIYFIVVTLLALFFTVKVLESRRWR
jgi:ABC-2 type transport system permease protein